MNICTICARGGSKGVPNKNVRLIKGKPLIQYSIEQALKSGLFEYVVVSSDSDVILKVSKEAGAHLTIKRPDELATDTSAKIPVMQHAFLEAEKHFNKKFDFLVDLDCTSPLRNVEDIQNSYKIYSDSTAPNLITGAPSRRSPFFNLVEMLPDGSVQLARKTNPPITRRQDAPRCFDMNASIYIWRRENLLKAKSVLEIGTIIYEMPEERSLDIDSELDFKIVSLLINEREDL